MPMGVLFSLEYVTSCVVIYHKCHGMLSYPVMVALSFTVLIRIKKYNSLGHVSLS